MDTISRSRPGPVLLLAIVTSSVIQSFQQDGFIQTDSEFLLDGYPDLPDCSDEKGCKCSTEMMDRMDGGEVDTCPFKLSFYTYDPTPAYDARAHGYLHVRFEGKTSAPLCVDREPEYYIELASRHCRTINVTEIRDDDIILDPVEIPRKPIIPVEQWAILQEPTEPEELRLSYSCPANKVLRVTCPDFDSFHGSPKGTKKNNPQAHIANTDRQNRPHSRSPRYRGKRGMQGLLERQYIVGGEDAAEGRWPFIGILVRNGKYFCMVIIVNKLWVITAAHCIHGMQTYYYEVVVGKFRRLSMSPYEQTHRVLGYKDPGFEFATFKNDIAMLKLATPLHSNRWVRYATLATTEPALNDTCFISGWGALEFQEDNQILSNKLKMAELRIMNCTERSDAKGVLCAGLYNYTRDSCQGDSGGPMVCQDHNQAGAPWLLTGLVSFGFECARKDHTGGYTSIAYHLKWINDVIADTDGQKLIPTVDARPSACRVGRKKGLPCPDLRCRKPLGEYLDRSKICNGQNEPDCLFEEDEQHCDYSLKRPTQVMNNPYTTEFDGLPVPPIVSPGGSAIDEFLQSGLKNIACDHCPHLHDYTDEENCTPAQLGCPTPDQIPCPFGSGCFPRSERCSGKNVCSDGGGELGCVFLSKNGTVLLDRFDLALPSYEGYPYVFVEDDWKLLCVQDDITQEGLQLLADVSCHYLGYLESKEVHLEKKVNKDPTVIYAYGPSVYSHLHSLKRRHVLSEVSSVLPDDRSLHEDLIAGEMGNIESLFHYLRKTNRIPRQADESCSTMQVSCQAPLSGKVRMHMFSRNPSVHRIGALPWGATVYRNGKFLCSATLVFRRWVIASGSCSSNYNHAKDNVQVVLGINCVKPERKGWGPYEQVIRVAATYRNNAGRPEEQVALLKLEKEPNQTVFVNSLHWEADPPLQNMRMCATIWRQNILELAPYNCTIKPWCLWPTEKDEKVFQKIDEISLVACRANRTRFETWWSVGFVIPGTEHRFQFLSKEYYIAVKNLTQERDGDEDREHVHVKDEVGPSVQNGSTALDTLENSTQGSGGVREPLFNWNATVEVDADLEHLPCFHTSCPLGKFQCFSSECIELSKVRDGHNDCPGGEDEEGEEGLHCSKELMHTNCTKFCDGNIDCPSDGIDEKYCGCPLNTFRCYMSPEMKGLNKCIQKKQVCNLFRDCDGGEDEKNCFTLAEQFRNQENVLGVWPTTSHGYILQRTCGQWHAVAADKWNKNLSYATCNKIGLGTFIEAEPHEINITAKAISDNSFRRFYGKMGRNIALDTRVRSSRSKDVYKVMFIRCRES